MSFRPYLRGVLSAGASAAAYDTDAQAYIDAVELADGEALEAGVTDAINDFVVGCKSDGIWTAIKASCILAGARTLDGALTPLIGSAPTNVATNFVSGDYNRKTGLVGNQINKSLDTNIADNVAGSQNDHHISVYIVDGITNNVVMGCENLNSALIEVFHYGPTGFRSANNSQATLTAVNPSNLCGLSRNNSATFDTRASGASGSGTKTSNTLTGTNYHVFNRNGGTNHSISRIAFYSAGEALTLADLDTRVSALMTAIDGAIA